MWCVTRVCYAPLRPTLGDPVDCSPPGSTVHGISQARIVDWVAICFSVGSSRPRDQIHVSCGLQAGSLPGKPTQICMVKDQGLSGGRRSEGRAWAKASIVVYF